MGAESKDQPIPPRQQKLASWIPAMHAQRNILLTMVFSA
jgi:hypothetical protein